jgi:hypothetical protein
MFLSKPRGGAHNENNKKPLNSVTGLTIMDAQAFISLNFPIFLNNLANMVAHHHLGLIGRELELLNELKSIFFI